MIRVLGKTTSRWLERYFHGPDHPMKMRLWYGFWGLLGHPRLTVPYTDHGWISLDPRDYLQGQIFDHGSYEPEVWEALVPHIQGGDVFWDVGAHIGAVSIRAGLHAGIREVHSFEPNPPQREALLQNVAMNRGTYHVHALALGDRRETRVLYQGLERNTGLASFQATDGRPSADVTCETIDELVFACEWSAPTLMKIDVEGWELAVLRGATRLFAERAPRALVYEWPVEPSGKIPDPTAEAFLTNAGYRVRRIPRRDGAIEPRENFLAVRA